MISRHPTKETSEARRAQLGRLKEKRRIERNARGPTRHAGSYVAIGQAEASEPSYVQVLTEIQRIAMGGVMPSEAVFDLARPATWPTANESCVLWGLSWEQLAEEAGLKWLRKR